MTFQLDKKFLNAIESLKKYGINVNPNGINRLYETLKLYQQDRDNPEYPLYLVLRELGGKTYLPIDNIDEQLSDDISTIVFENYFAESKDQTISHILREIQRISRHSFTCNVLDETIYDEDSEQTSVTIQFAVLDKTLELTHEDEYGDGSLLEGFLSDKLLPALKDSITKGHILYTCEFSINLIYFENDNYFNLFKEDFSYYKEI
jgi:hypothetical protein